MSAIHIPVPELQINFSKLLKELQEKYLQEALSKTIEKIELATLDRELSEYVPAKQLKSLAKYGIRGERIYPVPYLLESNPFLIGYYRLLLGFSQKEFYSTNFGVSGFKTMEEKGIITERNKNAVPDLCKSLIKSAVALVDGIGIDNINSTILDNLTLLTIGPQLRGGANVQKGTAGIVDVFKAIYDIVQQSVVSSDTHSIELKNAAGRKVMIEFASDPDIIIKEEMTEGKYRNIIAIEVKGGKDFSNIHNRVGEAEKSHQKAKQSGYVECWTVVNVDRIDIDMAKRESPSTNTFYLLSSLQAAKGTEYQDFKDHIISLTGIRT
jgi:hypothetical protein